MKSGLKFMVMGLIGWGLLVGCGIQKTVNLEQPHTLKYVCPEWFGAKNDGKTDCTQAIQKMFDYMATNDIYVCKFKKCDFKKGEFYLISKTINVRKPVKIEGGKSFVSSRTIIPYGDNPQHPNYLDNGIAFHFFADKSESPRMTDICLNIKVHAKPFFFSQLKNVYVHDCYVSTFTGDSTVTNGLYTFWFAFQCDELSNAYFKNVHIDQPTAGTKYNSADGIHLSGGCHDIVIESCYGQAGDDFIAMNTNENHSGNIWNVKIEKCTIGKKSISAAGIRFYGCSQRSHAVGKPQLRIYNVTIDKNYIRTGLSPCIFFTNAPDWKYTDHQSLKLKVEDITISNCTLVFESLRGTEVPSIWVDGSEVERVTFNRINSTVDSDIELVGLKDFNEIHSIEIKRSRQNGEKVILK